MMATLQCDSVSSCEMGFIRLLEDEVGIEPTVIGFAGRRLTTWLLVPEEQIKNRQPGAGGRSAWLPSEQLWVHFRSRATAETTAIQKAKEKKPVKVHVSIRLIGGVLYISMSIKLVDYCQAYKPSFPVQGTCMNLLAAEFYR